MGLLRNQLEERPASDRLLLEILRSRIGRVAEEERSLLRAAGEAFHTVRAEERVHRHRVRAQDVEGGLRIRFGGGGDVAALGVKHDKPSHRMRVGDDLRQGAPSLQPARLVESAVRLVCAGEWRGGIDDHFHAWKNLRCRHIKGGIEAHAEEGIEAAGIIREGGEEGRVRHVDMQDTGAGPT